MPSLPSASIRRDKLTGYLQPMLHYRAVARTTTARVLDVLVCILGVVGMAYTTSLTINSWVNGDNSKTPGYCDGRMP